MHRTSRSIDQKEEKMKKVNHEIVLFLEPSEKAYDTPSKIGYLFMNRFAIDEDAGFEIRKVFCLSESGKTDRGEKGRVFSVSS